MKLIVPTNWDRDLIEKINKSNVEVIYGKLDRDFAGGGRPSSIFRKITKSEVEQHIHEIHKNGLKFYYLLNTSCLGNNEWSAKGDRKLHKLLGWLSQINVDGVVVAIPYVAQLIKKHYPQFDLSVSCFAQVNSVKKAEFWEDLGAISITLSQTEVTRDFPLLRKIRENVSCKLNLLVNDNCLYQCPMFSYHNNLVSHGSQTISKRRFFIIDYCRFICRNQMMLHPEDFIRSAWIRPEDTAVYEEIGIDGFKTVARSMTTEAIAVIVNAYTERMYKGNLYDLFTNPSRSLWLQKKNYFHKIRYFFHPFTVNIFKLIKAKKLLKDMEVYIDNAKLDGFIDFFLKESCRYKSCDKCGYCHAIAEKAVRISPEHRANYIEGHGRFIEQVLTREIFKL